MSTAEGAPTAPPAPAAVVPAPPRIVWSWEAFARGAVLGLPAAAIALHDLQAGAVLAVGLIPAVSVPLPPTRHGRVRVAAVGFLAAASLVLGGLLALWPPAAVVGILVLAVASARAAAVRPRLALLLYLCLPVTSVAFSYPGLTEALALGGVMVAGSAWAVLVGLAWPLPPVPAGSPPPGAGPAPYAEDHLTGLAPGSARPGGRWGRWVRDRARARVHPHQASSATAAPRTVDTHLVSFGYRAGLAGAVCTAIGFAADLEHVGWAPAAALLVMRPAAQIHWMRSWNRLVDVVLGAAAAIAVTTLDTPPVLVAGLLLVAVMTATAIAGSRWYLLPLFSTFFVFLMLLTDDPDAADARFLERVGETALGIGVAAVLGIALPAFVSRVRPGQHSRAAT